MPRARVRMAVFATTMLTVAGIPALAAPRSAGPVTPRTPVPLRAGVLDVARHSDVSRLNLFTTNFGSFAWDLDTGAPGLIWPRGTNQTAVFAAGLWVGCRVGPDVRVTVAEYSQEYGPGGMVGGTYDNPLDASHRVYKMARWTGDPADSTRVERSAAELAADPSLDPLLHHAWSEYIAGAKPFGAPTRIYRLPDTSTPQPDDSVDVEGPDVLGDQMLWEVHNDADPARHTNDAGGTAPLGIEVQQTTFAYDRSDDLGNILFFRFRVINQGASTLDNVYVSLWSDPDVGGHTDDLVGCDVGRSLGYAYNASNSDAVYGSAPPAVGFALLRGPVSPGSGLPHEMTAFSKYVNGTDPSTAQASYNYMQGLHPDGSPVISPVTGLPTTYMVSGDPVTVQGWLDASPADRRMALGSGPGRMLPGESEEIWAALIVGRGPDRLASVRSVQCLADLARNTYLTGFSSLPPYAVACSTGAEVVDNCPRPASYWGLECAAGGTGQLSAEQLGLVAWFVNDRASLFDWGPGLLGSFCTTIAPAGTPDLRQRARSEFAAFLANYSGSLLDLSIGGGERIFLDPATGISCPGLAATTLAELVATAPIAPAILSADYLDLDPLHPPGLVGINFGLPFFGGGASEGSDFLGSSLTTLTDPDSFTTVEIRFSPTATQTAHRLLRLEKADGSAPAFVGRGYAYSGSYPCDFQVWDVVRNVQLDAMFVERALVLDDDGTLSPDTSLVHPSMNRTWAPTDEAIGDREYLLVLNRPYSATPKDAYRADDALLFGTLPVLYALAARRPDPSAVIDDGDVFEFRWGRPGSPGADRLLLDLEGQSLADPAVQAAYQGLIDCLSAINAGIGIGNTCDDDPTPALVSLVSVEASPDRVVLRWYCGDGGFSASVERRAAAGAWTTLGAIAPDGVGMLEFEDREVVPGGRYDYRLAVASGDHVDYLGQTSVEVPAGTVLALRGARPDPGDGRLRIAFSLATREPARLEVLDVAGRRLLARDLGDLAPGDHTFAPEESLGFPAGIYLLRLTQGARRVTGKAALVR